MKTTHFKGDLAAYTGNSNTIHGGTFYEVKLLEGHSKGQLRWVRNAPDGTRDDDATRGAAEAANRAAFSRLATLSTKA